MKVKIEEWANAYIKETEELIGKLKYHNLLQDDVYRAEGRIQAYIELKKFLSSLEPIVSSDSLIKLGFQWEVN